MATCSAAPTSTLGDLLRLLHRRLDAVEPELVGALLGVVDDVVERAGERVDVGGVELRALAPLRRQPVQDVVDDAVALLLAQQDLARELRLLGVVAQQVTQQQAGALHVAARLLEKAEQLRIGPGAAHDGGTYTAGPAPPVPVYNLFTSAFTGM